MDIYEDLERLVPPEHKDAFLRLSRQLKEYGDHNPELRSEGQSEGEVATIANFLAPYQHPAVAS